GPSNGNCTFVRPASSRAATNACAALTIRAVAWAAVEAAGAAALGRCAWAVPDKAASAPTIGVSRTSNLIRMSDRLRPHLLPDQRQNGDASRRRADRPLQPEVQAEDEGDRRRAHDHARQRER